jgi:hypothetical protein
MMHKQSAAVLFFRFLCWAILLQQISSTAKEKLRVEESPQLAHGKNGLHLKC